jgi:hypothetical protein
MTKRFLVPISTDHIDLDLNNVFPNAAGRIRWDSEEGTVDLGMNNNVVQSVGMEFFMPPTKNNSGVDIPAGSFVMATGAQGDRITIAKAVSNSTVDAEYMIGIAAHTILDGSESGLITTHGTVKDINTSLWEIGDILYPNPAVPGGLTKVEPSAPNIRLPIAIVLRKHENTGRIYVRMDVSHKLSETLDVDISSPQNNDVLSYNSTSGMWQNTQPPSIVPSGTDYPLTNLTNGELFYNTSNGRTGIYFSNIWKEFAYVGDSASIDNGNSFTQNFENTLDGGNSSTTIFVGSYDGGVGL